MCAYVRQRTEQVIASDYTLKRVSHLKHYVTSGFAIAPDIMH
jgi:hypothetical protein